LFLILGLDNQNITNGRNSVRTPKFRTSILVVARIGRVEEAGITTRSVPTLRRHFKTEVLPLVENVFARLKQITIIVFIERYA
jgi:hypothetical protein